MPTADRPGPGIPKGASPVRKVLPLHGVTLLVVEDSRYASEALRLMCRHSGARMRRAETLDQARRHLAAWQPDVVIVDMGLPDGDGTELIAELSRPPGFGPALIATSGDPDLRQAALGAGAAGFLDKPPGTLAGFQAAILRLFPGAPTPESVPELLPRPDPLALTDDLAHAAAMLARPGGQAQRHYLTQFLSGLARSAGDGALAQAARRAALGEDGLPALAALLQARLAAAPAPFGPPR